MEMCLSIITIWIHIFMKSLKDPISEIQAQGQEKYGGLIKPLICKQFQLKEHKR